MLLLTTAMDGGMVWLAVIGAANMGVALCYYAAIIAAMYLQPAPHHTPIPGDLGYTLAAGLCLLGTIVLGVLPEVGLVLVQRVGDVLR